MLGAPKLALAAAYALVALSCPAPAPPPVHMDFVIVPPIQRNDLDSHQLGNFHIDTTFVHSRNETFTVGGLTVSQLNPEIFIDFNVLTEQSTGQSCLSMKDANIVVKYAPTIYISSDFPNGSCRFNTTLVHETRHVNTDVITFNELLPQMRQAVEDEAAKVGAIGPVAQEDLIPARDKTVDRLMAALAKKTDELEKIRFDRQQAIDTRYEYLRTSALCNGEPLPKP